MTKLGLFFKIVPHAVHALLPSMLQCLDHIGEEAFILLVKNVNSRYDVVIITVILVPSQMFFDDGEQMIVRFQIRRLGRVINRFKVSVMYISHWNQGLVCWSIGLMKHAWWVWPHLWRQGQTGRGSSNRCVNSPDLEINFKQWKLKLIFPLRF